MQSGDSLYFFLLGYSFSSFETGKIHSYLLHSWVSRCCTILLGLITEMFHFTFNRCCWCLKLYREILSDIMPLTMDGDQTRKCEFCSGFPSSSLFLPCPLGPGSLWGLRITDRTKGGRPEHTTHGLGLRHPPGHRRAGLVGQGP